MTSGYLQRLLDRPLLVGRPSSVAPSSRSTVADVVPSGPSASPIAQSDQRLNDPNLAAQLGFRAFEGLDGSPELPLVEPDEVPRRQRPHQPPLTSIAPFPAMFQARPPSHAEHPGLWAGWSATTSPPAVDAPKGRRLPAPLSQPRPAGIPAVPVPEASRAGALPVAGAPEAALPAPAPVSEPERPWSRRPVTVETRTVEGGVLRGVPQISEVIAGAPSPIPAPAEPAPAPLASAPIPVAGAEPSPPPSDGVSDGATALFALSVDPPPPAPFPPGPQPERGAAPEPAAAPRRVPSESKPETGGRRPTRPMTATEASIIGPLAPHRRSVTVLGTRRR